jgi:tRNA-splicing ligase RtcB
MINKRFIKQLSPVLWEILPDYKPGMTVPARIYATEKLLKEMDEDVFEQITNVASLPGIVKYAICMPDGHSGYGFPIGGVAAFAAENGVISPGGIGFDINCGMRLVRTNLSVADIQPKLGELIDLLFHIIPAGVGARGIIKLSKKELTEVMVEGVSWCLKKGYGWPADPEFIEEHGRMSGANPAGPPRSRESRQ